MMVVVVVVSVLYWTLVSTQWTMVSHGGTDVDAASVMMGMKCVL